VYYDYDGDAGTTIRFGDGVFGEVPLPQSMFDVTYRVGGGSAGNVAADAIVRVDSSAASIVNAVTNPFPAAGGADEESDERVRRLAPQAFRARQYRAVRPGDYADAAERLPWVLRAGTAFRWTGSWLTVFTTADPRASETIALDERIELIDLLDRYRMAGYESYVLAPNYVALDLVIRVCALADAFRGDVEAAVAANLRAFFAVDNFRFGTSLRRGALEAAIQRAPGVEGVLSIAYRRRGVVPNYVEMRDEVDAAADEVLRVDNDPSRPERGTFKVSVEGGK
jgi:predicted phage baseplate assembly protein